MHQYTISDAITGANKRKDGITEVIKQVCLVHDELIKLDGHTIDVRYTQLKADNPVLSRYHATTFDGLIDEVTDELRNINRQFDELSHKPIILRMNGGRYLDGYTQTNALFKSIPPKFNPETDDCCVVQ